MSGGRVSWLHGRSFHFVLCALCLVPGCLRIKCRHPLSKFLMGGVLGHPGCQSDPKVDR